MTRCIGVKGNGELCQRTATSGSDYCTAHDPARVQERKRSASKAARSKKPHNEVSDIKLEIREIIDLLRSGEMDRADAVACGQLFNTILRGIELQRRLRELEDLEQRLETIENRVGTLR
jgi:hypothetical protein